MSDDAIDPQSINTEASALMKQGIEAMGQPGADAAAEALTCFDRALALRRQLPLDDDPLFRYGLAACLLNRADALVRLGSEAHVADAIRSYDEGIGVMQQLRLTDDPRFPRRLAIAHQNRALALLSQGDVARAAAAFTATIEILEDEPSATIPDRDFMMAAVWLNLAVTHAAAGGGTPEAGPETSAAEAAATAEASAVENAEPGQTAGSGTAEAAADAIDTATNDQRAHDAAQRAIALVAEASGHDPNAAGIGLQARHILCQIAARRLSHPSAAAGVMPDDVHAATDAVDEGLELVRHWERQGIAGFRGLAYDLFRFGARVYAIYQPQFLEEFVSENVDPERSSPGYVDSDEMRAAAEEALRQVGR